jgi:ATP-dependent RNA helicase DHX8/PRP22
MLPPPPPGPVLPDAPVLGGVYRGTISGTMEFGCFVELIGMRPGAPKAEGMVHVTNISKRPITSAKDAVKRGQEVWVKVLGGLAEPGAPQAPGGKPQRITLSMRDVDQATGKDLLPTHLLPGAGPTDASAAANAAQSGLKVRCVFQGLGMQRLRVLMCMQGLARVSVQA